MKFIQTKSHWSIPSLCYSHSLWCFLFAITINWKVAQWWRWRWLRFCRERRSLLLLLFFALILKKFDLFFIWRDQNKLFFPPEKGTWLLGSSSKHPTFRWNYLLMLWVALDCTNPIYKASNTFIGSRFKKLYWRRIMSHILKDEHTYLGFICNEKYWSQSSCFINEKGYQLNKW